MENRLISERSPYLRQHAENPVHWFPWCQEAFDEAARQDRPVFLSIGYATCHWCHVMAHESFEDTEVARLLNRNFVCIKVDREERPDLDALYMKVCQVFTGGGGWPLSLFLTPERKPFFAATYIPRTERFGIPGMLEMLPNIISLWKDRRTDVLSSAEQVTNGLSSALSLEHEGRDPGPERLQAMVASCTSELEESFDAAFGGFSFKPKFPSPHLLLYLFKEWNRTGLETARAMAEKTLQEMRRGGIFDQVGLGFHRYSTDGMWRLPHFEKMVVDQAMHLCAYATASLAVPDSLDDVVGEGAIKQEYRYTVRELLGYLEDRPSSPDGLLYTAEDADTGNVEGFTYTWPLEEVRTVLGDDSDLFIRMYGLEAGGNFQDETTGSRNGRNVLYLTKPLSELASGMGMSVDDLRKKVSSMRTRLLAVREKREQPLLDDKLLCDVNGLMLVGYSQAYRALGDSDIQSRAHTLVEAIFREFQDEDGRLFHCEGVPGMLEDYAYVTWGLLELYRADHDPRWIRKAIELSDLVEEDFSDPHGPGWFQSPVSTADVIVRLKSLYDGAVPSGNSVMAANCFLLSRLTGTPRYWERAVDLVSALTETLEGSPSAYVHMLSTVSNMVSSFSEVVVVGNPASDTYQESLERLRGEYLPHTVVIARPVPVEATIHEEVFPWIASYEMKDNQTTFYVCRGNACQAPVHSIEEMLISLRERD